jgi:His/Glu/Gln/Arg/opine family amino acid ABC transporter permease subunit
MFFDFIEYLPPLLRGAGLTIAICAASGVLGSLIGVVLGTARTSPSRIARWLSTIYISFIRGVPILIILLFTYFALPLLAPSLTFSREFTAIVGLSIYSGAYMAEIVRGGIQAVPKGQSEAAEALGMHYLSRVRYVVFPQALRIAVPRPHSSGADRDDCQPGTSVDLRRRRGALFHNLLPDLAARDLVRTETRVTKYSTQTAQSEGATEK